MLLFCFVFDLGLCNNIAVLLNVNVKLMILRCFHVYFLCLCAEGGV